MNCYEEAWEAAERARQFAPESIMPWTPRIAILNRKGNRAELDRAISELLTERPNVLDDPVFRDHVENDVDFIGVKEIALELKSAAKENQ